MLQVFLKLECQITLSISEFVLATYVKHEAVVGGIGILSLELSNTSFQNVVFHL
jgi:hypothetical protein